MLVYRDNVGMAHGPVFDNDLAVSGCMSGGGDSLPFGDSSN